MFVCLTETFVNKEDNSNLDNIFNESTCLLHLTRSYPNTKDFLGVCCVLLGLIYCIFFQHWPTDHDNLIVFKVEGRFFG